jgi:hypothetical protein
MTVEQLPHLDLLRASAGYPNFWFSSPALAQAHANERGGRLLQVGNQAVILAVCD